MLLLLITFDKLGEMGIIAMKFESARVRLLSNVFAAAVAVVFAWAPQSRYQYVLIALVLVLV